MPKYPFHPLADIFPLMDESELRELANDIYENGQEDPVVLAYGQILDGRNRALAFDILETEHPDEDWTPDYEDITSVIASGVDPLQYVLSKNLHRRHLTTGQKALIGVKIKEIEADRAKARREANLKTGNKSPDPELIPEREGDARDLAAKSLGISGKSIDAAEAVTEHGVPELQEAVRQGKVAVTPAAKVSKLPPDQQREAVAKGKRGVAEAVKAVEAAKKAMSDHAECEGDCRECTAACDHRREPQANCEADVAVIRSEIEQAVRDLIEQYAIPAPSVAKWLRSLADRIAK